MEPTQPRPEPQPAAEIERYRDLASRCRQMAEHTADEAVRKALAEMAGEYERLVVEAESRGAKAGGD